jgi:hypothetical protein
MMSTNGGYPHHRSGHGTRCVRDVRVHGMVRDTSRSEAQIASYALSAVGFLGAGVIFKNSGGASAASTRPRRTCEP